MTSAAHRVGYRAAVVVVSTSAAAGSAADRTGPVLVEWLRSLGYDCADAVVVADGDPVRGALTELLHGPAPAPQFVVTTGGTGLTSDDLTPDITAEFVTREVAGVMHALWAVGQQSTPRAVLSRGIAGVCGHTFIVNLPGSVGGVRDGMAVLTPLLPHLREQLADRHHGHSLR